MPALAARPAPNLPSTEELRASFKPDERTYTVAARHGISQGTMKVALAAERARQEAHDDPVIDPKTLPKSDQQKLAIAQRQQQRQQEAIFQQLVSEGVQKALEAVLPALKTRESQARLIMRSRKGIMQRETYRLILSCLHPDSRANLSAEKLGEAFQVFKKLELLIVAEKEMPTPDLAIPRTYDDLMAMRKRSKNGAATKA